jgi:ABC-2 type transport system ATP-binding protein
MNTVILTGLDKSYGRTLALSGVDLVLSPGITGLLGPNGAGKTTMLRILATALAADRGSVRILGQDPTTNDGRVAVRQRLGYVPQETGFPRGFTAFAFVDYMAILKEWTDLPARHEEVRRVLGSPAASGAGSSWPRRCSGALTCWSSTSRPRASTLPSAADCVTSSARPERRRR